MKQMFVKLITILMVVFFLWIFASYADTLHHQWDRQPHNWNFFELTLRASENL